MTTIRIGRRTVGGDAPCYVIAEAGVNHNGDAALAHRLVDIAAGAGADAVKFQTFDAKKVASSTARKAAYQERNDGADGSQAEMLSRLELPVPVFRELRAHCDEAGVDFISTAFDHDSLDVVADLAPATLKWPSGEIDNLPLIDHAAGLGLPVILSTGMATLGEVETALERFARGGCTDIAILHCTSNYPAAPEDLNLRAMATLATAFRRPVGFSDHSAGTVAALAARPLGMSVLEKHYTSDRGLPGPDHLASLEPGELSRLICDLRDVEAMLGDGIKRPCPAELETAKVARRSITLARDLPEGHVLAAEDLVMLRPASGLPPSRIGDVLGRRLSRSLAREHPLSIGDLGSDRP